MCVSFEWMFISQGIGRSYPRDAIKSAGGVGTAALEGVTAHGTIV